MFDMSMHLLIILVYFNLIYQGLRLSEWRYFDLTSVVHFEYLH